MKVKYFFLSVLALILLSSVVSAQEIDLSRSPIYVKKGFSPEWIFKLPVDQSWTMVSPALTGKRSVRVIDLGLDLPKNRFLSFRNYSPETFTYLTDFRIMLPQSDQNKFYGLYLAQIGMNWEIYLNGKLLRREMYLRDDGDIAISKNLRDVLIHVPLSMLKEGENILAFRIIGDPTYKETGFFLKGKYVIDDYEKLQAQNSETTPIVLMFIYLSIGLYHIFLFIKRTREKYNLFYGLFSMTLFVYLLSRTHTVYSLIGDTTQITRMELVSLYMLLPSIMYFFDSLFKNRIRRVTKVYRTFCGIFACLSLFVPLHTLLDLLFVWQITALLILPYLVIYVLGSEFVSETKKCFLARRHKYAVWSFVTSVFYVFTSSVSGNLIIGLFVTVVCAIYDILDSIYFNSGIALMKYGFMVFVVAITLILAKRFQNLFSQVEDLNVTLQQNIDDLNNANEKITLSEAKYRLLVEGSQDIIFTLDEDLKFLNANSAIRNILKMDPEEIHGSEFLRIVKEDSESISMTRRYVQEQLAEFSGHGKPIQFRVQLFTPNMIEPREMQIRFEYIAREGKKEILGKASSVVDDSLVKYFVTENTHYEIQNYLFAAEEISYRLTENIVKYMEPKETKTLRVALREIIINSIEHGNLEITFEDKSRGTMNGTYFEFIGQRQNDPRFKNRKVEIHYSLGPEKVVYEIRDDGKGFDYERVMSSQMLIQANEEMLAHGRGLSMAKNMFDSVTFDNNGSKVTLVKYFKS